MDDGEITETRHGAPVCCVLLIAAAACSEVRHLFYILWPTTLSVFLNPLALERGPHRGCVPVVVEGALGPLSRKGWQYVVKIFSLRTGDRINRRKYLRDGSLCSCTTPRPFPRLSYNIMHCRLYRLECQTNTRRSVLKETGLHSEL